MEKFAPITQEVPVFIGSEAILDDDGAPTNYVSSILTPSQALQFIDHNYESKACDSLNHVFLPYCTYDSSYDNDNIYVVLPSGRLQSSPALPRIGRPTTLTVDEFIDDAKLTEGNVRSQPKQRSIGINKDVYFVGERELTYDDDDNPVGPDKVAGPLDIVWDDSHKKWKPNIELSATHLQVGFITSTAITAPSTRGQYTTFNAGLIPIRNYDVDLAVSNAKNLLVIVIRVKTLIDPPVPGMMEIVAWDATNDSDDPDHTEFFWLPIYIGCRS